MIHNSDWVLREIYLLYSCICEAFQKSSWYEKVLAYGEMFVILIDTSILANWKVYKMQCLIQQTNLIDTFKKKVQCSWTTSMLMAPISIKNHNL